tara:strand:+ start:1405 stop:1818 length:414 start_codon:yes stop_codon:yes gene_type:complete
VSKILGIDYGTKRIGLAISDSLQLIASPLTTISTNNALSFLADLIKKESISCFVIGYPKDLMSNPTDSTFSVEKFEKKIIGRFPNIKIHRFDERFTSKIARRTILDSGLTKSKRRNKELVDKISATLILQDYLSYKS